MEHKINLLFQLISLVFSLNDPWKFNICLAMHWLVEDKLSGRGILRTGNKTEDLSINQSNNLSINQSNNLFVYQSNNLSINQSNNLSNINIIS